MVRYGLLEPAAGTIGIMPSEPVRHGLQRTSVRVCANPIFSIDRKTDAPEFSGGTNFGNSMWMAGFFIQYLTKNVFIITAKQGRCFLLF